MTKNNEDINEIFNKILLNSEMLIDTVFTDEEVNNLQYSIDFFQARINNMMKITIANLNWYQDKGWMKFIEEKNDLNEY